MPPRLDAIRLALDDLVIDEAIDLLDLVTERTDDLVLAHGD